MIDLYSSEAGLMEKDDSSLQSNFETSLFGDLSYKSGGAESRLNTTLGGMGSLEGQGSNSKMFRHAAGKQKMD
ncbi:hypothetical protein PIB30_027753 [Stylosanthes scabra]|uniref:Uncharacterized protein n=1 Tax=Stylosanthes scabra TaxID=79078 RepID=A0ABU6Y982_9FABA|nr:hypothetical protein [Stylosanthes scabra]